MSAPEVYTMETVQTVIAYPDYLALILFIMEIQICMVLYLLFELVGKAEKPTEPDPTKV